MSRYDSYKRRFIQWDPNVQNIMSKSIAEFQAGDSVDKVFNSIVEGNIKNIIVIKDNAVIGSTTLYNISPEDLNKEKK
jgi:predicted transcriptional regulator